MFSDSKEITKIKDELKSLKALVERKAKQASKKCSEYRNRCLEAKVIVDDISESTSKKLNSITSEYEEIKQLNNKITEISNSATSSISSIEQLNSQVETIQELFDEKESLNEKIESLIEFHDSEKDTSSKIGALHTLSRSRKNEIDELYYEIFGYEEEGEEEENDESDQEKEKKTIHVDGLKDKLEKSYSDLTSNLKDLEEQVENIDSETEIKYSDFIDKEKKKYSKVFTKIEDLLPDALTAGLSHAYSEKKEAELTEGIKLKATFNSAIKWLVGISLIPFAVNVYLFLNGSTIESIINDLPKMVFSILPLYIPVVWLAYSASKKVNLSKRLVEEYSHKEVLSKTFEGLSSQVEGLEESNISSELRIQLLTNILSVSAENPGKLISDYNTSDHPVFDWKLPFMKKTPKEVVEDTVSKVVDEVTDPKT